MNPDSLCMGCMGNKGFADTCRQCGWREGTSAYTPLQLAPRTLLEGRFLLGRALGQGGFGITYLAWDLSLDRKLAIKEYFPLAVSTRAEDHLSVSPLSKKSRPDFEYGLNKFAEEGRHLARFKDSAGIVAMLGFFHANGTAYIVMEYVEGVTFKQYLEQQGGKIPFEAALKVLVLVMDALREVHAAGMLHRDISPDNIYVENNGQIKILDFGATRYAMGEQSQSLSVVLKPGYAPEEQYRRRGHQGPWTDVYASAATFYRAITGQVPPEAPDRLAHDELIPPSRLGVVLPAKSEAALLKALAVRGENRFQNVLEFRNAIEAKPDDGRRGQEFSLHVPPSQLSKVFFLTSIAAGLGLEIILSASVRDPGLQIVPLLYVIVVMMVLFYRMWKAIQDGHARTSPGKAIGFLFIPAYNLYWLFQVFWGFAQDYNRFIDRHSLRISKLPEGLFLASNVACTILAFTFWIPGLFQTLILVNVGLLCVAVAKACDVVNALAESKVERRVSSAKPLALHCISGEFRGNDLQLDSQGIIIGRSAAHANLVLSSDEVSAQHVRVWPDTANSGIWVEDMNSTNGTFYHVSTGGDAADWVRLSGRRLLTTGSRFRIGPDLAEFEVRTA